MERSGIARSAWFSFLNLATTRKLMNDIECPYCEADQEVNHDDGFGYEEGTAHEMECSECGKSFVFQTHISFDYYPSKADCLNGVAHDLKEWREYAQLDGVSYQNRHCKDCDHEEKRTIQLENR